MIGSDPFLSDSEFFLSDKISEVFDGTAIGVEDAESFGRGKGDRFTKKIEALFAREGEVSLDAFEGAVGFRGNEGEIEGAVAGSDVQFGKCAEKPVASWCIIVLSEDFFHGGTVIFGGGEICANEQPVLGSDGVSEGTKNFGGPEVVDGPEEKDNSLCARWIEIFQERGKDGAGA